MVQPMINFLPPPPITDAELWTRMSRLPRNIEALVLISRTWGKTTVLLALKVVWMMEMMASTWPKVKRRFADAAELTLVPDSGQPKTTSTPSSYSIPAKPEAALIALVSNIIEAALQDLWVQTTTQIAKIADNEPGQPMRAAI